jgi:DNA-directed RNA polymerase specialized sigma24 family protein
MTSNPTENQGADRSTATHWSVVLRAGSEQTPVRLEALETLCRTYWYPLYCFARRLGSLPEDAKDLTQGFFAVFLQRHYVNRADPGRGRFRTFLLTSFRNFLTNEWKRARTLRRGGGWKAIPLDAQSAEERYRWDRVEPDPPDKAYDKTWAISTLQQAMKRVRNEYVNAGKADLFDQLKLRLWGDPAAESCADMAERLHLSEAALKMATTRLRQRFRDAIRREVEETVADPAELDGEIRYLISALQNG